DTRRHPTTGKEGEAKAKNTAKEVRRRTFRAPRTALRTCRRKRKRPKPRVRRARKRPRTPRRTSPANSLRDRASATPLKWGRLSSFHPPRAVALALEHSARNRCSV